eukprot:m.331730 g.331730  ORF g.331730 m.331730 type:complete len:137 (+) comp19773_c0_seq4:3970-4380(+)
MQVLQVRGQSSRVTAMAFASLHSPAWPSALQMRLPDGWSTQYAACEGATAPTANSTARALSIAGIGGRSAIALCIVFSDRPTSCLDCFLLLLLLLRHCFIFLRQLANTLALVLCGTLAALRGTESAQQTNAVSRNS